MKAKKKWDIVHYIMLFIFLCYGYSLRADYDIHIKISIGIVLGGVALWIIHKIMEYE